MIELSAPLLKKGYEFIRPLTKYKDRGFDLHFCIQLLSKTPYVRIFSMIFIEMSKKYPVYSLNNLGVGDIAEIFAQSRMLTKGVPLSN